MLRRAKLQCVGRSVDDARKHEACSGMCGQIAAPIVNMTKPRQAFAFLRIEYRCAPFKVKRSRLRSAGVVVLAA
jgi:hypothetical protein